MKHTVQWLTAAPLWSRALDDGGSRQRFRQPAVLRFDSDSFMEELLAVLAGEPSELDSRVARPETWEQPGAGWVAAGDDSLSELLKLYQPAHGRFYLVAASLTCRRPGLPCRKVDSAAGDRASMVVRRLVPDPEKPQTFTEQAWVGDRERGRWQPVAAGRVLDGEERLPLFALSFRHEGRPRRLHAGMIPVAGRELYEGVAPAGVAAAPVSDSADDFAELADPRKAAWSAGPEATLAMFTDPEAKLGELTHEAAREILSFFFLDLADQLRDELADLWQALVQGSPAGLSTAEQAVYNRLAAPTTWTGAPATWRQAVLAADAQRPVLLGEQEAAAGALLPVPGHVDRDGVADAAASLDDGGSLTDDVYAALGDPEPADLTGGVAGGAPAAAARGAAAAGVDGGVYRVCCVYEQKRCGRLDRPVISAPSRPFRLGSFFDPEATVRPLQIRLPLDTSIAGLRKFPKAVSMLVSNKLRRQVARAQSASLEDLDEGDIDGDEPSWSLGMICSLSIPIITICAFILLMIFVQLLNIVFWWLPFFKICLPIPVRSE